MISFVLATYNERENLPLLVERLAGLGLGAWEVVVVDDASPDGTGDVAEQLKKHWPVRVIHRTGKLGLASAIVAGLRAAQGEVRIVMDADLSHDHTIVPALVTAIESGVDVAVGSRFAPGGGMEGWPKWRQSMSRVATWMAQLLFHVPVKDPMSGYFAVQKDFFINVAPNLNPRGYKILLELLVRGKPSRVQEVGFVFHDRQYGKSKVSLAVIFAYLRMLGDLFGRH